MVTKLWHLKRVALTDGAGILINGLEQLFAGDQDFADESAAESEGEELSEEDKMAASVAEKMTAFMVPEHRCFCLTVNISFQARSNPASPQPVPKVGENIPHPTRSVYPPHLRDRAIPFSTRLIVQTVHVARSPLHLPGTLSFLHPSHRTSTILTESFSLPVKSLLP